MVGEMARWRRIRVHLAALGGFAAAAIGLTWPLASDLSRLSGAHGDGPMFLWDLWWLRHALLDHHRSPFATDHVFVPVGADLWLHTLTPARGVAALLLSPWLDVVAANNLLVLTGFVLAAWGMMLLAVHVGL